MAVILREGLYHIGLLLKDIGGLACKSLLKTTLESAITARDLP